MAAYNMKQVPLAFCLMSRRRKNDYKKVSLTSICLVIPYRSFILFIISFYKYELIIYFHTTYLCFQVLKKLIRCLPAPPAVEEVVADFESGVWGAVRSRLPQVLLRGCAFHWGQAVWRKIQELGLQVSRKNIVQRIGLIYRKLKFI